MKKQIKFLNKKAGIQRNSDWPGCDACFVQFL